MDLIQAPPAESDHDPVPPMPWAERGACRDADPELFFGPDLLSSDGRREGSAERRRREARAKAVCATCPVLALCAAHALSLPESYGVWGGMGESERLARLARLRPPAS